MYGVWCMEYVIAHNPLICFISKLQIFIVIEIAYSPRTDNEMPINFWRRLNQLDW